MDSINKTAAMEALAPFLKFPRRTVIEVEACTSGIMLLLLLQLILGSFRRQSTSRLVQAGAWMTYTVSLPAIAYTLGLMQSSPVKNVMYPIWAVSLLMAAGCTNAVRVYELNDNRQWKRSIFNTLQCYVYACLIYVLLTPSSMSIRESFHQKSTPSSFFATFKSPALVIILLCGVALWTAGWGTVNASLMVDLGYKRARRVAKFMKKLPAPVAADDDLATMNFKGYKYLVYLGSRCVSSVSIDQILQCEGRLLSSGTDHSKVLKDKCLAFAMFQLLKQRYHGMTLPAECLDGTRDFFLNELLHTEGGCERAFRIVEMELGLFHDHFFTKHAIIFQFEIVFFFLFMARILLISTVVYFVLQNKLSVKTTSAIIEVHSKRIDDIITLLVLATILLVDILQAAFYLASDWCKVSVTCRYARNAPWCVRNAFTEKLIIYLSRFTIFGYWKNCIGQHLAVFGARDSDLSGDDLRRVKQAVVASLVSCDGVPTNGEGSLGRNGVLEEFSWALRGRSQAEIMLIWNVATYYCHAAISCDEQHKSKCVKMKVSVSISRYCAYLMNSAPELLPGNFGDTKSDMDDVQGVFKKVLKLPNSIITQAMDEFQDEEEGRSIFVRGVKLGKQLKASPTRWKIIADFWAEKILYIAPTANVNGHLELLAKGGEFLTHIWVLLTHAGVLEINRHQPSQEDV